MPEDTNVAILEATEKQLQEKKAELEKVTAETEEAKAKKQLEVDALSKEAVRVRKDIDAAKEERRVKDTTFQEKLRNENLSAAKEKFFGEYGIKEQDAQAKYLEIFKKFDSGAVNTDLIISDLEAAYASAHAKELLGFRKRIGELSASSEQIKEALSSSGFTGSGFAEHADADGLTEEDKVAAKWSGIPIAEYTRLKKAGRID